MPNQFTSKYRHARESAMQGCHRSILCGRVVKHVGDKLFYALQPLDQLREELKEEFDLTDEELDQVTRYLL